jgi:UDP-2,3-diacylglucosamine hydrolase
MNHTLFISDLHLSPESLQQTKLFLNFCETQAPKADALYILGDFFEAYLGDDEKSEFHTSLIHALKKVSSHFAQMIKIICDSERAHKIFFIKK